MRCFMDWNAFWTADRSETLKIRRRIRRERKMGEQARKMKIEVCILTARHG